MAERQAAFPVDQLPVRPARGEESSSLQAASFTCQICFEEHSLRLTLPQLKTGNGDLLRHGDCGHPVCIQCMAAWVTARVEEQRVFGICCPAAGCRNELFEQDVR